MSKEADCIVIIVSEESGKVSIAKDGKLIIDVEEDTLRQILLDRFDSKINSKFTSSMDMLKKKMSPEEIRDFFAKYYEGEKFIRVMPFGADVEAGGAIFSDACAGWDGMEIFVTGNEDRVVVATRFDNLGKGASGAAIQCMNIVLGCDEAKGLNL